MNRSNKTEMINYHFILFTGDNYFFNVAWIRISRYALNFSIEMKLAYISISNNKMRNNTQIAKSSYSSNKKP